MKLNYVELLTKKYDKFWEIKMGTVTGKFLEDDIGSCTNPLLIIPTRTIGAFVANSTYNSLNPYPLRLDINKYYFYHKYIDVLIVELNHDDLETNRFMLAERFIDSDEFTGRHQIYEIY